MRLLRETSHLFIGQRSSDKNRVRTIRPRFNNLVLVNDEVLAQAWQWYSGRGQAQIFSDP